MNDDCADDVLAIDHDSDHQLSGPFHVEGAQPGDVLAVDIVHLEPSEVTPWGMPYPAEPTEIVSNAMTRLLHCRPGYWQFRSAWGPLREGHLGFQRCGSL